MANSKAEWTSEWHKLPNGVYWWRFDEKESPVAVRIFKSLVYGFVEDQGRWLNTYGGEFLGPLSPSDAEQLMELRKALAIAIPIVEHYGKLLEHPSNRAHYQEITDNLKRVLNRQRPEKGTQ